WLRDHGAQPFIVPAMGSHGGATAEGQAAVLASYGITEETMGAPVRSSMETVQLDSGDLDLELFMDRYAAESDGVLLVNRVKLHTDFHGYPESGLMKMGVIGLGKHAQALAVHGRGIRGLKEFILPAGRRILESGKILGGLAIVENAYDRPVRITAADATRIEALERELLGLASARMARLPLEDIDLLIVDDMGKDVSGTGLDTNVIGRTRIFGEAEPETPRVRSILVTRLTEASHGNAIGIGLVDVITRELYDAIDFGATYENGLTSSFSERIKVPFVAESLDEAVRAALRFVGLHPDPDVALRTAKIVRVRSTLELSHLMVSEAAAALLRDAADVSVGEDAQRLLVDGRLSSWPKSG
ncbi:MAG TPA: DUF2088 domain-containing protein, partial [Spirochaetia bacterium]|nr:DUF2088 domain-containing protein [Spirochaetia bacterium]